MEKRIPIVLTKFTPPLIKETTIGRIHLMKKMRGIDQSRMTLIHSGPGYGKSTSIASYLKNQQKPYVWLSVTKDENHIHPFIIHMIYAIQQKYNNFGQHLLEYLMTDEVLNIEDEIEYLASEYVNELMKIREKFIIVIDDMHLVASTKKVERWLLFLIEHLPKHVHLILSSRIRPKWNILTKLVVHGDLLEMSENELAFSKDEIEVLFTDFYHVPLKDHEVDHIYQKTEGWIIAIQMIWQQIKLVDQLKISEWEVNTCEDLFRYLALEVFSKQPKEIKDFLLKTSIIEDLHPMLIDELIESKNAREMLTILSDQNLFIYQVGDEEYRYHALFKDFLLQQLRKDRELYHTLHQRLAKFYDERGQYEKAINHYIEVEDFELAAQILQKHGLGLLSEGKIEYLSKWMERLSQSVKNKYCVLWFIEGEINRYYCHYEKSLIKYNHLIELARKNNDLVSESLGNEGKAKIFLDTIQPAKADEYLARAIDVMEQNDTKEKRILHLYSLMAENLVNLGKAFEAETWLTKCKQLDPNYEKEELESRLYLRTGRLTQAIEVLTKSKQKNKTENQLSRSHRETDLILSLVYSYMGEDEKSKRLAEQGILRGTSRKAPFVEACGWIRMGHAVQIQKRYKPELAVHCYETALELMEQIKISRGKSEAYLGLCLLYGKLGKYEEAVEAGKMALEEPLRVKDIWLSSYVHLALGIAALYEKKWSTAQTKLQESLKSFNQCGCLFGQTLSLFWLSKKAYMIEENQQFFWYIKQFLTHLQNSEYEFLLSTSCLYGPQDIQEVIPMILEAKKLKVCEDYVSNLLMRLGYEQLTFHPGYTLKVQLFGDFQVWLGSVKVADKAWKREKAKELFQLLLTKKGRMLSKTEIISHLWGDAEAEAANRDFKVALNALNKVLEPNRKPREAPFFVVREGSMYGLNEEASYDIDSDVFQELVQEGLEENEQSLAKDKLKRGIELYVEEFLPSRKYEDWCSEEREQLAFLYLRGCEKLAQIYVAEERFDEATFFCEEIIKVDCCWEEAYRLLMYCYYRKHNRTYALRIYEKCKRNLEKELGVEPMDSTIRMLEVIKEHDKAI